MPYNSNIQLQSKIERDRAIFNQLKQGNKQAFSTLFDLYGPAVYGIILKWVNNNDIATQIFQKCFNAIREKCMKEAFPKFSLFVWICSIAADFTCKELNIKKGFNLDSNKIFSFPQFSHSAYV